MKKIQYLRIALALQNIGINDETADRIIQTYEKTLEKGGEFNIKDAVEIQYRLDKKYAEIKTKNNG